MATFSMKILDIVHPQYGFIEFFMAHLLVNRLAISLFGSISRPFELLGFYQFGTQHIKHGSTFFRKF